DVSPEGATRTGRFIEVVCPSISAMLSLPMSRVSANFGKIRLGLHTIRRGLRAEQDRSRGNVLNAALVGQTAQTNGNYTRAGSRLSHSGRRRWPIQRTTMKTFE